MRITFDGAARTVTGSQHLLEVNGQKLLLDCGMYQGKRAEAYRRNRELPFNPREIDAVILSHAHIDHSGNLPSLVAAGYRGPIFTTSATAHLANVMLLDAAHIQESDAQYLNKKRRRKKEPPVTPLYTQEDAALVAQFFQPVTYGEMFAPIRGVQARLEDAGHILGSAAAVIEYPENGERRRLWYSGDIGRRNLPLLRDPVLPRDVDYLIMECTYGDRPHDDPQKAFDELHTVLERTLQRGGKVIIPAFAVGRTQELVYDIHQLMDSQAIPRVPVVVDSPLAVNASDIFRLHPEVFDQETQDFIRDDRHRAALGFDMLTYTRSVEDSKALNEMHEPMIIISASGMAETGRILHHLKNNLGDPRNTILIVSWQAPDTLGRRLADQETRVNIFGEPYTRRAEVVTINGLSAHAGQHFLVEYALASKDTLRQIFLVHGEPAAAEALERLLAEAGERRVCYPELYESVEV